MNESKFPLAKSIAGFLFVAIISFGALVMSGAFAENEEYKSSLPVEKLVIETKEGKQHTFNVEIAYKPVDVQLGLMYRKSMEKDHGMLFEIDEEKEVSFWMKNTYIPLDLIFVAKDGRIVNVHREAQPNDLRSIPSVEPVTGVVEINGGLAEKLGIGVGDRVLHPYFRK
jgi:uncharacterized protein